MFLHKLDQHQNKSQIIGCSKPVRSVMHGRYIVKLNHRLANTSLYSLAAGQAR